ncbi:capsid protein [Crucivirus-124]|nr:capsid protein [Crucivirus-124]
MPRQYSDKEKAAYYKKKATMVANPQRRYKSKYPKKRYVKKRYDYPGAGYSIGSSLGGNVGGPMGSIIGGAVGQGAQSLVKRITGFGDYKVSKNALVYNVDAIPEFSNDNERCTMICHREFISDIISSVSFNANTFRINPSIVTTFPWLASVARNWEQYVVQGMVFEFKTTSATAIGSTNTGLGTVIMATQYNSLAPEFSSKQQMENYEFSQSTIPSASILHPIECDPTQTQCGGIFNTYDPDYDVGDRRLYDIGRFTLATVGMQEANSVIGELWVTYKICLLKPRLTSISDVYDFFTLDTGQMSPTYPIGDPVAAIPDSSNSGIFKVKGTIAAGQYLEIDAEFIGIMQVVVAYVLDGGGSNSFAPPYANNFSSSIIDVTGNFIGVPSVAQGQNVRESGGPTFSGKCYTATFFLRCLGGRNPDGTNPRFQLISMAAASITFQYATIQATSINVSILP